MFCYLRGLELFSSTVVHMKVLNSRRAGLDCLGEGGILDQTFRMLSQNSHKMSRGMFGWDDEELQQLHVYMYS